MGCPRNWLLQVVLLGVAASLCVQFFGEGVPLSTMVDVGFVDLSGLQYRIVS